MKKIIECISASLEFHSVRLSGLLGLALVLSSGALQTDTLAEEPVFNEFTDFSIEELLTIRITSVSKAQERYFNAASAVYVITGDEIRRSGHRSIPEILRMVPGLQVARFNANTWAITSRGFSDLFSSKLLVLIDGRAVYTPLFAGVYWDVQDLLLEDVDRIEVIRGPGAALWGSNAVNGVINIITRKAKDTQGGFLQAGGGTEAQGFGSFRYGGAMGEKAFYRFYGKYFQRDNSADTTGNARQSAVRVNRPPVDADDEWSVLRGGFRIDWDMSGEDSFTFQGDIYGGKEDDLSVLLSLASASTSPIQDERDLAGGNFLTRWEHVFSDISSTTFQFYYDRTEREDSFVGEIRDTIDFDFQHNWSPAARHDIVWGAGYRRTWDDITNSFNISLGDPDHSLDLFTGFVQDRFTIIEDRLYFTLGSKIEHNDFTGFEIQPSGRFLWMAHEKHRLWAAISRAVRTPDRARTDSKINLVSFTGLTGAPTVIRFDGSSDFDSEDLLAFEIGYRVQPADKLYFDATAFYNTYDNLASIEPGLPFIETTPSPVHVVISSVFDNKLEAKALGFEVTGTFEPASFWQLKASYSFLDLDLELDSDSGDTASLADEGRSPKHQVQLHSRLNLPGNIEADTSLYYVDRLPADDVDAYVRLDFRLGWRPNDSFDCSFVAQDLLDSQHAEVKIPSLSSSTESQRAFYLLATWRF